MWTTTVTVQRPEGTTLTDATNRPVTHLPVKVDASSGTLAEAIASAMLPQYHSGIKFKILVDWQPNALLKQADILIDEAQIDPDTGTYYKYRVIARPMNFVGSHQQLEVETVVGTV
jgi:hypothetical protein